MPVTVTGTGPTTGHYRLGLWGADYALGDLKRGHLGAPWRAIWEIFGPPEAGKNTWAFYALGRLAPAGKIIYTALEGVDRDYIASAVGQSGFNGEVALTDHLDEKTGKPRPHAAMLQEMVKRMWEPDVVGGLFDSVGRLRPPAEEQGDYDESAMGRRAMLVNKFLRDAEGVMMEKDQPIQCFILNHVYKGGMGQRLSPGVIIWATPGGDGLKFTCSVRIHIRPKELIDEGAAYISSAKVEKLRYGGRGRSFSFAMIPGLGVSPQLTAVIDCEALGLAERGQTVKVDGKSVGRLGALIKAAGSGNTEKFAPFYEALHIYEESWVTAWQRQQLEQEMEEPSDPAPESKADGASKPRRPSRKK